MGGIFGATGSAATKTQTSQQKSKSTYKPAGPAKRAMQSVITNAGNTVAQNPYQAITKGTAGLTPAQQEAMALSDAGYSESKPYLTSAGQHFENAANALDPEDINKYFNPYQAEVMKNLQELYAQNRKDVRGRATQQAGGVGNTGINTALANQNYKDDLVAGQTFASIYQNALQAAQNQQGIEQASAYGLGQLGTASLNSAMAAAQQKFGFGQWEQMTEQERLNAAYEEGMRGFGFPYAQQSWYAGQVLPAAGGMGGTTTSQGTLEQTGTSMPAGPSPLSQGVGLATAGLGAWNAYSDASAPEFDPTSEAGWAANTNVSTPGWFGADGGRIKGYADGGSPLGTMSLGDPGYVPQTHLQIPQAKIPSADFMTVPPMAEEKSEDGGMGDIANLAMKALPMIMMAIRTGGRVSRADGGGLGPTSGVGGKGSMVHKDQPQTSIPPAQEIYPLNRRAARAPNPGDATVLKAVGPENYKPLYPQAGSFGGMPSPQMQPQGYAQGGSPSGFGWSDLATTLSPALALSQGKGDQNMFLAGGLLPGLMGQDDMGGFGGLMSSQPSQEEPQGDGQASPFANPFANMPFMNILHGIAAGNGGGISRNKGGAVHKEGGGGYGPIAYDPLIDPFKVITPRGIPGRPNYTTEFAPKLADRLTPEKTEPDEPEPVPEPFGQFEAYNGQQPVSTTYAGPEASPGGPEGVPPNPEIAQGDAPLEETETLGNEDGAPSPSPTATPRGSPYRRPTLFGKTISNESLALMAAGLGMMGGTSPFAGQNIGAGGLQGINTLKSFQDLDAKREADWIQAELENKRLNRPIPTPAGGSLVDPNTGQPISGSASGRSAILNHETASALADNWIAGDNSVFTHLGRGNMAAMNANYIRELGIAKMKALGLPPQEIATRVAAFQGFKASQRTLGNRLVQIQLPAKAARALIPAMLTASKGVDRTEYPSLNRVIQAYKQGTGDPNVVKLSQGINALVNVYSRFLSPTGVPTVSDKDHAREILEKAWSHGQLEAAAQQMQVEIDAELQALREETSSLREDFAGNLPGAEGASPEAATPDTSEAQAPAATAARPASMTDDQARTEAKAKITSEPGTRELVIKRLNEWGISTEGL